jgi:glycosyltransferase involved in cell wall biosynthesis
MNLSNKISVIIPFFNEEENIEQLLISLETFFSNTELIKCEVVFVDDGSTDNSVNVFLNNFIIKSFEAKLVKLSKNEGSHSAVRAGLIHATGDYAIFLPADLQDPLELILILSNKINEGFDIVFASRKNSATGYLNSIFSKIYSNLMRKYVHENYPNNGFDVVFFNRKVIDKLNENIEANSSIMLQIMMLGFRQSYIPYKKEIRKRGVSKWTFSKKVKLFIDSFIAFSYVPIRFVTILGISLFISGIAFSVYLFIRKLLFNDLVSGWTMLITILTIGFGITNISLGIIAEYLWRTFDSSRKRPVFIIDDIIDLKN